MNTFLHLKNKKLSVETLCVFVGIIALLVLLVLSICLTLLPINLTHLDVSSEKMYTVSEISHSFLHSIDKDVSLYFLCADGHGSSILNSFLNRYSSISKHIHLEIIDTSQDKNFINVYGVSNATNYSILVVSDKRSTLIDYKDLFTYYCPELQANLSLDEYAQYGESIISSGYSLIEQFAGDTQLTNAIAYCLTDNLPCIYTLKGHGEAGLPSTITSIMSTLSIRQGTVSFSTQQSVPDDCDGLFIIGPTQDFTENEIDIIKQYLNQGGHIFITTDFSTVGELPVLLSFLDSWGMSAESEHLNIVMEGNPDYLLTSTYPYLFISRSMSHPALPTGTSTPFLTYMAHPIFLSDCDKGITPLYFTSDKAFIASADNSEESDTSYSSEGVFCVGAISEDKSSNSTIIWIPSSANYSDAVNSYSQNGNYIHFLSIMRWMCQEHLLTPMDIPPVATNSYLSVPYASIAWVAILTAILIPGIPLAIGIVIKIRRRHRTK